MKLILNERQDAYLEYIYEIDENDFINWCKENDIRDLESEDIVDYIEEHKISYINCYETDSYITESEFDGNDVDTLNDMLNEAD